MKQLVSLVLSLCVYTVSLAQPGTLDSSFGMNGIDILPSPYAYGRVNALLILPNNKILAAGVFGGSPFAVLRCNIDGSVDKTFAVNGMDTILFNSEGASSLALKKNGDIFVGGGLGWSNYVLAKYDSSGKRSTSFNGGIVTTDFSGHDNNDNCQSTALQKDGKIILAGMSDNTAIIARYDSIGSLDTTFSHTGYVREKFGAYDAQFSSIMIQPSGKIVAAGYYYNVNFLLIRYNTDGSRDSSFGINGLVTTTFDSGRWPTCNAALLQPDGKILAAGSSSQPTSSDDFAIARYSADGVPDSTFGINGKVTADIDTGESDIAYGMALESDGKIVLAGRSFGAVESIFALARFNTNGTIDSGFGKNGRVTTSITGSNDRLYSIAIQPDDKIVVGGNKVLARYWGGNEVSVKNTPANIQQVQLYPNPTTGICTITSTSYKNKATITVTDVVGKTYISKQVDFGSSSKTTLNLSALPGGVYTVKVQGNNISEVMKVVKE